MHASLAGIRQRDGRGAGIISTFVAVSFRLWSKADLEYSLSIGSSWLCNQPFCAILILSSFDVLYPNRSGRRKIGVGDVGIIEICAIEI